MATKKQTTKQNFKQSSADELAKHIAAILNHPDTPTQIYNDLADGVCSLDVPTAYFDSEEYIAMCLRNHFARKGGVR